MSKKNSNKIITRFPPSPTGLFHIGSARTALFNYLFARQKEGQMLLRLEDTDKKRSKKEFEENILESLDWLKIDYDGEFFKQSERTAVYKKYLEKMIEEGKAYLSKEKKKDDESQEIEIIRFKNTNVDVIFDDLIRGTVKFNTAELGDFVIAKGLDEPLYHLTVVVDDFESGVNHIIRGEDHISNTARQILIQEAIGAPRPSYAHLPLILAPDKSKMSKRHGAVSLDKYRKKGYLPEAIINYLALLGWNSGTEQEIFSRKELIEKFDLQKVQKGGAIFDIIKLNWINKEHIKLMSEEDFKAMVLEFVSEEFKNKIKIDLERFEGVLAVIKERIEKFEDVAEMERAGEFDYYFEQPLYDLEKLNWKDEQDLEKTAERLEKIKLLLEELEDFKAEKIKEKIWDYANEEGRGFVLWPMRYALSGKDKSPDPFLLAEILGKEETFKRLNYALEKIKQKE